MQYYYAFTPALAFVLSPSFRHRSARKWPPKQSRKGRSRERTSDRNHPPGLPSHFDTSLCSKAEDLKN